MSKCFDVSTYITKPKLDYRVMLNATREQIGGHVKNHPMVYLAIFITTSVEDCPDYSWMGEYSGDDSWSRVIAPMYVGNFSLDGQKRIVEYMTNLWFGDDFQEVSGLDMETTIQEDEIPGSY